MTTLIKSAHAQIKNPALPATLQGQSSYGTGFAFYIGQLWKATVMVGAIAFLLYFVWGGLEWILSGSDKVKVEQAQKKLTNGFIGLVLLVGSYAIIAFVQEILQINILNIDWTFGGGVPSSSGSPTPGSEGF